MKSNDGRREMTVTEAAERWLDQKRIGSAESSITTMYYRIKQFSDWCESNGIEHMNELTPWEIDDFQAQRRKEVKLLSLNKQLGTLEQFLTWCETRGVIEDAVVDAIEQPEVPKQQKSSDIKFDAREAIPQLRHFRDDSEYGSRRHALLELAWHVGCRMGAIRALDLRDFTSNQEESYLDFRHRAESGTPLKNKYDGERPVALRPEVSNVLSSYINGSRKSIRDEHGREPLFTSSQGRPSRTSIRTDIYFATAPCLRGPCPHGKQQSSCEWFKRAHISKCPSTRSPHQVRTGSVSWQLDQRIPLDVVAKRVNASPDTIKEHYDKSDPLEEMRSRRASHLDKLDIDHGGDEK